MWFKKLMVKITIWVLNKIKDRDFGEFNKIIDEAIAKAINALETILEQWEIVKKSQK